MIGFKGTVGCRDLGAVVICGKPDTLGLDGEGALETEFPAGVEGSSEAGNPVAMIVTELFIPELSESVTVPHMISALFPAISRT